MQGHKPRVIKLRPLPVVFCTAPASKQVQRSSQQSSSSKAHLLLLQKRQRVRPSVSRSTPAPPPMLTQQAGATWALQLPPAMLGSCKLEQA